MNHLQRNKKRHVLITIPTLGATTCLNCLSLSYAYSEPMHTTRTIPALTHIRGCVGYVSRTDLNGHQGIRRSRGIRALSNAGALMGRVDKAH